MSEHGAQQRAGAAQRRLEDRYVMLAPPTLRAQYLGTKAGSSTLGGGIAAAALKAWPRIKGVPILGPMVFGLYRMVRKMNRRSGS